MKKSVLSNNLANKTMCYRLEFNEKQQVFHLDYKNRATPNTHGWFTIVDNITDEEFWIYEAFVNRMEKETHTKEYLMAALKELKQFISNLAEYNIRFFYDGQKTKGIIQADY